MDSTTVTLIQEAGANLKEVGLAAIEAIKATAPVVWETTRQRVFMESIAWEGKL